MSALTPGTRLGSYEIIDPIGAGGMGEVYRARDTKLGREVAIKVLPEAFAENEERLARFEREARLLASLNHPNIATLYGFEQSNGVHFLAMELAEGETLAERLRRGPIPVDDALPIFKQIAEALEAAHEKGIIHRDLKPANIKVSSDEKVKVLDFGLAKAMSSDPVKGEVSESPTITRDATATGVILGTAAYMSPEQARGQPVDKRTDIWAFGVVLYEALTGRVPFLGETVSDSIAKILEREPNWEALPEKAPSSIRKLLRRCLQKDPARRQHDIADARIEIEENLLPLVAQPSSGNVSLGDHAAPPVQGWLRRAIAIALLIGVSGSLLAVWISRRSSQPTSVVRFNLHLPNHQQLLVGGFGTNVAIAPDGNRIVYRALDTREKGAPSKIYVREIDALEARPIRGTEGARMFFFSPDGQSLGFNSGQKLKKVSLSGSAPVALADMLEPLGGTWGDDGSIVFKPTWSVGLTRVDASGEAAQVLNPQTGSDPRTAWPHFLPGSQALLFTVFQEGEPHIAVLPLKAGDYRKLTDGANAQYSKGYLIFGRADALFAMPFDPERLQAKGAPIPVIENLNTETGFSLSRTGSLVYLPGGPQTAGVELLLVDRQGKWQALSELRRDFNFPRFSPDGGRIAVQIEEKGNADIWIFDLRRKKFDRLTFDPREDTCPVWSPDGERLLFWRRDEGLFWKRADGSGSEERLLSSSDWLCGGSWQSQSNLVVFEHDFAGQADIQWLSMDSGQTPLPFTNTASVNEYGPRISPDGRWLVYTSEVSEQTEVFVRPFPNGGGKWQISTRGGTGPVWSPTGQEIFFLSDSSLMAVDIAAATGFAASEPRLLFEVSEMSLGSAAVGFANYDIAPDGMTLVMVTRAPPITEFTVILNWMEEVKRLVPAEE